MPPHLSVVQCLYPLPRREHGSVANSTKGQWWASSLLLVVLKGAPALSSADGGDSFILQEQQPGQSTGGGWQNRQSKDKANACTRNRKNIKARTHVFASRQSVWLLLTVVPGHSVPEAETCRVLHRCGWSVLQCAWAPGHREDGGSEAEKHAGETKLTWAESENRPYLHATLLCRSLAAALVFLLLRLRAGDGGVWSGPEMF